jgi:Xaa-Pro aminopeptidase
MSSYADRLAALREQLKADRLDGFVVPLTDEHMSEYVGSYAQRLAWLTGFDGSAGAAVVLPEEAAIFVDGRYTLQVRDQVDPDHWSYQSVPQTSIAEWLSAHAPDGGRIGYDPWLHTSDWVKKATEALAERGAELVPVARNPIDAVWSDRPEPSRARLAVHGDEFAGKSSAAKRQEMAEWLAEQKADAAVLAALDSIAWTFNVRGQDVARTPVALAFALVQADGTADLFVAGEKVERGMSASTRSTACACTSAMHSSVPPQPRGKTVVGRSERSVAAIFEALEQAGAKVVASATPPCCPRRSRTRWRLPATSRAGARRRRARAFPSLGHHRSAEGGVDELSAQAKLREFRDASGVLKDLSFDTISGAGPNGAIIHYRCKRADQPAAGAELALPGRFGRPICRRHHRRDPHRRDRRARPRRCATASPGCCRAISASHRALPEGTRGSQLDSFARRPLWEAGSITPRHRPRRRQLPVGARRARSGSASSAPASRAATSRCGRA